MSTTTWTWTKLSFVISEKLRLWLESPSYLKLLKEPLLLIKYLLYAKHSFNWCTYVHIKLVHIGTYCRYILVHIGVHNGTNWCILVHIGAYWYILVVHTNQALVFKWAVYFRLFYKHALKKFQQITVKKCPFSTQYWVSNLQNMNLLLQPLDQGFHQNKKIVTHHKYIKSIMVRIRYRPSFYKIRVLFKSKLKFSNFCIIWVDSNL